MPARPSPRSPRRTQAAADAALRLIRVDYAPLPFVVDPGRRAPARMRRWSIRPASTIARRSREIPVAPDLPLTGNVRGPDTQGGRGDIAQGFAEAEVVVEGDYRTQTQTHCCMEPHAIVADWREDGLTVWMSTQSTAGVRRELAQRFGLKLSQVRVKVAAMGGGFGSKSQLGTYGRVCGHAVAPGAARRCGWCSIARRNNSTAATVRPPGSTCALARAATAR